MSSDFRNKTIFITGASSGIGEEFAKQFHALGANIVLAARRKDRLEAIARDLNHIRENSCTFIEADLTDRGSLEKVTDFIKTNCIDVLINNAGFGSLGYFEEIDIKHETRMVSLNISSTIETLHAVIPQMKKRKAGAIISLSSVAAFLPMPFMATYAGTKVFNFYHTMAIRSELSEFGIRVLTVCPGPTDTEFFGAAHLSGMAKTMKRDSTEDVVRQSIKALKRNKAYIVTGFKAKCMHLLTRLTPYWLSSKIVKKALK